MRFSQKPGRGRALRPLFAGLAAAVLGLSRSRLSTFVGVFQRPLSEEGLRPHRIALRSGESTIVEVPLLKEAKRYPTDVDPITGDVDFSSVPEEMGVYAVYDSKDKLQYVGLSRQIRQSVANHVKNIGPKEAGSLISAVRVAEMPGSGKDLLKSAWEKWIKEHMDAGGDIPLGNLPENSPGADARWRNQANKVKPAYDLGGPAGIMTMSEAQAAVKKAVETIPIIIFMKGTPAMPQCGFSARSIGILKETGANFEAVNILDEQTNPGVREAVKQYSKWPTIPQLFVKGKLIGGADIIAQLHESGELQKVLRSATGSSEGTSSFSSKPSISISLGDIRLINEPSRPTATAISQALEQSFTLSGLRIVDESAAHEGDAGALSMGLTGESHFRVEVVAQEFDGLSAVERQQKVYDTLDVLMKRIHALSIVALTPSEL